MEVLERIIYYRSRKDEFHIYPMGDEHLGTKHCAEGELVKQIKVIKEDEKALWIGIGDKAEFITPSDPRWDVGVISDWVSQDNIAEDQTARYCDIYMPIADKCLGLLEGNHEDAIRRHSHIDVQKNICNRLGVNNLGYSCFVKLVFRRGRQRLQNESFVVTCFFTHGSGWAITKGAKLNRLQRLMDAFEADIYGTGHMHDIITDTKPYLMLDGSNKIRQREKVGAVTGCWFKTYTQGVRASYGEKRNYPPSSIGAPTFTIIPNKQVIFVTA